MQDREVKLHEYKKAYIFFQILTILPQKDIIRDLIVVFVAMNWRVFNLFGFPKSNWLA